MSGISLYLLSIVGVVILGVVIDLVLHEGSTAKYIKSLFALFVVFVIVAPLPKLINGDIDLGGLFTGSQYEIDNGFLNTRRLEQAEKLKSDTEKHLSANGFSNVVVDFSLDPNTSELKILAVYVDLTNLVLAGNNVHINKYTAIRELIKNYLLVDEGRVIMYG